MSKLIIKPIKKEIHEYNEILMKIPGFQPSKTLYTVREIGEGLIIGWYKPLNAEVVKKGGKQKRTQ